MVTEQQDSDGLQAHPAVDGLGGQGVAQLVGVDVPEPCCGRGLLDGLVDPGRWDRAASLGQQHGAGLPVGALSDPGIEEVLQLGKGKRSY